MKIGSLNACDCVKVKKSTVDGISTNPFVFNSAKRMAKHFCRYVSRLFVSKVTNAMSSRL